VPTLAAAARAIVAANGYAKTVKVIEAKSTEHVLTGGGADVLVCEIVDDQLLGEGVLSTVADARRRLLKLGGRVVPRVGMLYIDR